VLTSNTIVSVHRSAHRCNYRLCLCATSAPDLIEAEEKYRAVVIIELGDTNEHTARGSRFSRRAGSRSTSIDFCRYVRG